MVEKEDKQRRKNIFIIGVPEEKLNDRMEIIY